MSKSESTPSDKAQKFEDVTRVLFALLQTAAPSKITHSLVAKKAGVSRAWLYKYIGADRDALIEMAVRHLGKRLTERDLGDVIETKDQLTKSIVLGMNRMFENTKAHPWFIPVYFKYRGAHGVVGQAIADVEQDYISRQALHFQKVFKYPRRQAVIAAEVLTSFRMGLAFSWQNGELSKKSDQTDVMKSIEHWMSELFMA